MADRALAGRRAVVTGSNSGIGLGVAEALAAARVSGAAFRLPADAAAAETRRAALAAHAALLASWTSAAAAARRETRLAQRVELAGAQVSVSGDRHAGPADAPE